MAIDLVLTPPSDTCIVRAVLRFDTCTSLLFFYFSLCYHGNMQSIMYETKLEFLHVHCAFLDIYEL